jgi:hypothetical protein
MGPSVHWVQELVVLAVLALAAVCLSLEGFKVRRLVVRRVRAVQWFIPLTLLVALTGAFGGRIQMLAPPALLAAAVWALFALGRARD